MAGNPEEAAQYLMNLPPWIQQRLAGVDRRHLRELAYAALLMSDGPENYINSAIQRESPDINDWRATINPDHPQHSPIVARCSPLMNSFVVYERLTSGQMITAKEKDEEQYSHVAEGPSWD